MQLREEILNTEYNRRNINNSRKKIIKEKRNKVISQATYRAKIKYDE